MSSYLHVHLCINYFAAFDIHAPHKKGIEKNIEKKEIEQKERIKNETPKK